MDLSLQTGFARQVTRAVIGMARTCESGLGFVGGSVKYGRISTERGGTSQALYVESTPFRTRVAMLFCTVSVMLT